jgi:hypothetical protein
MPVRSFVAVLVERMVPCTWAAEEMLEICGIAHRRTHRIACGCVQRRKQEEEARVGSASGLSNQVRNNS